MGIYDMSPVYQLLILQRRNSALILKYWAITIIATQNYSIWTSVLCCPWFLPQQSTQRSLISPQCPLTDRPLTTSTMCLRHLYVTAALIHLCYLLSKLLYVFLANCCTRYQTITSCQTVWYLLSPVGISSYFALIVNSPYEKRLTSSPLLNFFAFLVCTRPFTPYNSIA